MSTADGKPGQIQSIISTPLSQTAIEVTWLPPQLLGTSDPLLLRYMLFYSPTGVFNSSTMMTVIPPLPRNDELEVTVQLLNLSKGHEYVISVEATTAQTISPKLSTLASTYGEGELLP